MLATGAMRAPAAREPLSTAQVAAVVGAAAAAVGSLIEEVDEGNPDGGAGARFIGAAARDWAWRLGEMARGLGRNDVAESLEIDGRCELIACAALARCLYDAEPAPPLGGVVLDPADVAAALMFRGCALRRLAARASVLR